MERIAIIGLGLIGGSLALALKKSKETEVEIVGFSRSIETLVKARERGVVDHVAANLASTVEGADLVIIATPVMTIKGILESISQTLKTGCIVTDTGSTKLVVMQWAAKYLPNDIHFIGGHPMAGKETSGIDEADPDLLRRCIYCITPADTADKTEVQKLKELLKSIGASPFIMDAKKHDSLVAGVSHLPMLLSSAFVSTTMASNSWSEMSILASRGYRDLSRLASGNPEMNRDICHTNRKDICCWIDRFIETMREYRSLIERDGEELKDKLDHARKYREEWLKEER